VLFIKSKEKKARKEAAEVLQLARKIYDYRKDVIPEDDRTALENVIKRLEHLIKSKSDIIDGVKRVQGEAEAVMKRTGGSFYPKSFLAENSEMLLFAAILAIGIRSFFLQPFKIPTNSMYPSYNGMTAEVYLGDTGPNPLERAFRLLSLGASHYEVVAPENGELAISTERRVVPARK
jgi:signal peptidase I